MGIYEIVKSILHLAQFQPSVCIRHAQKSHFHASVSWELPLHTEMYSVQWHLQGTTATT